MIVNGLYLIKNYDSELEDDTLNKRAARLYVNCVKPFYFVLLVLSLSELRNEFNSFPLQYNYVPEVRETKVGKNGRRIVSEQKVHN